VQGQRRRQDNHSQPFLMEHQGQHAVVRAVQLPPPDLRA
jgi:hypothetical protein